MNLAEYAVGKKTSRGRLYTEPDGIGRTPWQRDRDRVIHSTAFRKLQYKTQVFVNHEGDFFRTRLTHSLEVAQIARSLARSLNLNEDLSECLALAHDLGHPPFGHAGEDALQEAMNSVSGFSHNDQSLRQVTKLEKKYIDFDGLNLTWESLEGLAKHNGPVGHPESYTKAFDQIYSLELNSYASAEAQIASISDDIAYHSHDLDDGLRSGLILFEDLQHLPLVQIALEEANNAVNDANRDDFKNKRLRHEMIRRVIDRLIRDLRQQTAENIAQLKPETVDDIRHAKGAIAGFSSEVEKANQEIKQFLYKNLYHHWRVNRMSRKAKLLVAELFTILSNDLGLLPKEWRQYAAQAELIKGHHGVLRVVSDYIAGMTDRFAIEEYQKLTNLAVSN